MIIQERNKDDLNEGDSDRRAFISICQLDLTVFAAMRNKGNGEVIITLDLSNICLDTRGYLSSRFGVSKLRSLRSELLRSDVY